MIFWRLWSLIRGYVVIVVEGKQIEKFINMAVSRGYNLWDISQPRENVLTARVDVSVYPRLRHIARTCRCKMKISRKRGLPFTAVKMRKRKMLFAGAVIFFLALYVLSSFIWSVEVTSSRELRTITEQQVLDAAARYGIKRGALRYAIDNRKAAEALEKEFMEVSWVGIEIRGTKVIIDVVEKIFPEEDERSRPGNIVAQKDGVIKEILVLSGEPKAAAGDTVKKGDILISGIIYPELPEEREEKAGEDTGDEDDKEQPEEPRYVSARGIVRARVWYEAKTRVPLVQHKEELTGQKQQVVVLRIGEEEVTLKNQAKGKKYKHFRTDRDIKRLSLWKYRLPVELVTTTYHQVEKVDIYLSMVEARSQAEEAAMKDISSSLPEGAEVVSRRTVITSANEKELRAKVYVETLENIARFVPLK
ncbi:MAG TPA: sporulation protein YqfD [Clostridia bacterium]|nr:sporulation protein YqfD [Clostridia bacterium]